MPTDVQKANRAFKLDLSVADTRDIRRIFEEPIASRPVVQNEQIWSDDVPATNPLSLTDPADTISGVVQLKKDITLSYVTGTEDLAYQSVDLVNSIQFNQDPAGSYNVEVKRSDNSPIYFGEGDWVIDNAAGVLRFYGTIPTGVSSSLLPKISFFKYIGATGTVPTGALGTIATQDADSVAITGGSITGITDLAIADGGTGASTAAGARSNLGLVIGTNVQAFSNNLTSLAAASVAVDNFLVGTGTGWATETPSQARSTLGLVIGTDVQAFDQGLQDISTIGTPGDGIIIVGNGSNWVAESGATARASLGLTIGTDVQAYDASLADISGLAVTDGNIIVADGTNWVAESGPTARASLGLAIGTDVQAYDTGLADISGLSKADSNIIVGNGTNWVVESGATARTSLGLTIGTDVQAQNVNLQDMANITVGVGNTDYFWGSDGVNVVLRSPATVRTALNLEIGTDVQAYSARLDDISGLSVTDGNIIVGNGTNWVAESGPIARNSLGLAIGTDVQAYSVRLDDISSLTPSDSTFIVGDGSNWIAETGATVRNSLGLGITDTVEFGLLDIDNIQISGNTIASTDTNGDITLDPNGTGQVLLPSGYTITDNLSVVTKAYADAIALGIKVIDPARAKTEAALPSYTQSGTGVGATLTATANGAIPTVDGVTLVATNRLMVSTEGSASDVDNGVYEVTQVGTAGTPWILTRVTDFDEDSEVISGAYCLVTEGTINAGNSFIVSTSNPIVVDTTAFIWTLFSQPQSFTGGTGIDITGSVISVDSGLDDIAGITPTDSVFIVGDGANWVAETGPTVRSSLGLTIGTDVQAFSTHLANIASASKTDGNFLVTNGTTYVVESGSTARASLGLTIGTDVQAFDQSLSDISGLTLTDGNIIVADGTNWVAESGPTARASLGLAIGTDVQAYDAGLTDIAGLAVTDGNFIVGNGTNWVVESGATVRASLGLGPTDSVTFGQLTIDNVQIDGNTITTTDLNGDLTLAPNGTGDVIVPNPPTSINAAAPKGYVDDALAAGDVQIGTPIDGFFGTGSGENNVAGLVNTDKIADAFDKLTEVFELLRPAPPPDLSTFNSLTLNDTTYSAIQAVAPYSTFTNVQNNSNLKPSITATNFGDASSGTLTASVKNSAGAASSQGSIALTTNDDTGIYGSFLEITGDVDFYAGQFGKEGFFDALTAQIGGSSVSGTFPADNTIQYSVQMQHSGTGNTNIVTFYQDDAYVNAPVASVPSITGVSAASGYVSGVPVLAVADTITAQVTCTNCVKKFYNSTWVAQANSSEVTSTTVLPTGLDRNEGSNPTLSVTAPVVADAYNENVTITMTVQNSSGVQNSASASHATSTVRVDTISQGLATATFIPETSRNDSGSGQYPALTVSPYNSATSLAANFELQLIGGEYQVPVTTDYSSNYLPAGPDYSALTFDGTFNNNRYYTQNMGAIADASHITIEILNPTNFGTDALLTDVDFQVYVIGAGIGILDGNVAYDGVSTPVANGDACLDIAHSTATVRRLTFGPVPRTGTILIRMGIPTGSTKKFGGLKMTVDE